jgi:hypothetical protein
MREKEICVKKDRSSVSVESFQTKCSLQNRILTKIFMINEYDKIIFARYNSYIMLPWFTISNILSELDEEKIKNFVNFFLKKNFSKNFSFFLRRINLVLNQFLSIHYHIHYFVLNYLN